MNATPTFWVITHAIVNYVEADTYKDALSIIHENALYYDEMRLVSIKQHAPGEQIPDGAPVAVSTDTGEEIAKMARVAHESINWMCCGKRSRSMFCESCGTKAPDYAVNCIHTDAIDEMARITKTIKGLRSHQKNHLRRAHQIEAAAIDIGPSNYKEIANEYKIDVNCQYNVDMSKLAKYHGTSWDHVSDYPRDDHRTVLYFMHALAGKEKDKADSFGATADKNQKTLDAFMRLMATIYPVNGGMS